jgi:hypothetical protein
VEVVEQPQNYAAELRAAAGAVPGGLLSGFHSASWPTPLEWWESVLRGAALILLALLGYKILDYLSYFVVGDPSSQGGWPGEIDSALQSLYPVRRPGTARIWSRATDGLMPSQLNCRGSRVAGGAPSFFVCAPDPFELSCGTGL